MIWFKEAGKETFPRGRSTTSSQITSVAHCPGPPPTGVAGITNKPLPPDKVIFMERTWERELNRLLRDKETKLGALMSSKICLVEKVGT